jgi:hypothetical protein
MRGGPPRPRSQTAQLSLAHKPGPPAGAALRTASTASRSPLGRHDELPT